MHKLRQDIIVALTDRDKAREKLPVFYGSRSAYLQGFIEVLNNACDEIINNFESGNIYITLHEDNRTITVEDEGRGLPIHIPGNLELILLTLFASGKYGKDDTITSGTNGVGLSTLLYSSEYFKVESYVNGGIWVAEFENGGYEKTPLTNMGSTEKHGTKLTFKLDETMYTNVIYNNEEIKDYIDKTSMFSNKITLHYSYGSENHIFHSSSLRDYFKSHISNLVSIEHDCQNKDFSTIHEDGDNEKTSINVVFAASSNAEQQTMLNGKYLSGNGTIFDGITDGIKDSVNKYLKKNNLYVKNEKSISNIDIENSVSFVANVLSNRVEYHGQTKNLTEKVLYRQLSKQYIQEVMEIYAIENPLEMDKLSKQVLISMRARIKSSKMMENVKKKLSEEITVFNKIPGLIECKSKDSKNNILCICEGKSALGSLIAARGDNHSLMALRGKVRNCKKSTLEQIFADQIITDIIRAIGAGVEIKSKANKEFTTFDLSKIRYGRIYIIVDADVDGMGSILPLLLTMFDALLPTLIEEGCIWLCETPKYEILCEDKYYYAINDDELMEVENQLQGKKYKTFYVKGLAELNPDTMAMCLSPDYKNVTQIRVDDIEKAKKSLELHMGSNIKNRKEYIMENFDKVGGNI